MRSLPGLLQYADAELKKSLAERRVPYVRVCVASGEGLAELMAELWKEISQRNEKKAVPELADLGRGKNRERLMSERAVVMREAEGFRLKNTRVEMLAGGTDLNGWEAAAQFKGKLAEWRMTRALEAAGVKRGDKVYVGNKELVW
jgi:hypothetical protein